MTTPIMPVSAIAKAQAPASRLLDALEVDLHIGLLGRCGNSHLRKTMVESQSRLLAHGVFCQRTPGMYPVEPFLNEHLSVREALRGGAVPEAGEGLCRHLLASSDRAVDRIAKVRATFRDTPPAYLEPLETVG